MIKNHAPALAALERSPRLRPSATDARPASTRIRASTSAPSAPAITGLRSSSAISSCASTIALVRRSRSWSASTSTTGLPRRRQQRKRLQAAQHLLRVARGQGASRTETSLISSASTPPAPPGDHRPGRVGRRSPRSSISTPAGAIAWTRKRSRASPASSSRSSIWTAASAAWRAPARSSSSAPSSVLRTISGPRASTATAPRRWSAAARPASSGSPASLQSASGRPCSAAPAAAVRTPASPALAEALETPPPRRQRRRPRSAPDPQSAVAPLRVVVDPGEASMPRPRDRGRSERRLLAVIAGAIARDMNTARSGSSRGAPRSPADRLGRVLGGGRSGRTKITIRASTCPTRRGRGSCPGTDQQSRWRSCRPDSRPRPPAAADGADCAGLLAEACTSRLAASQASAHMIPGPPALVMPTRPPSGMAAGQ